MPLFFLLLLLSSFTCRDATCGDTEGDFLLEEVECSKTIPTAMAYSASPRPVVLRNCSSDWTAQSKWQSMAFLGDKLGQLEAHYFHSGPRFIWSDAGREMGQVLGLDVQSPHNIAEGVEAALEQAIGLDHGSTCQLQLDIDGNGYVTTAVYFDPGAPAGAGSSGSSMGAGSSDECGPT